MHPSEYARTMPEKPAQIMAATGRTMSYRQLDEYSNRIAHLLRSCGLKRGGVVAAMLDNGEYNLPIAWAAQRSGLYLTCVSNRLTPAEAIYILRDSDAAVLIVSASLAETARTIAADLPGLTCFAVEGDVDGLPRLERAMEEQPATSVPDPSPGADMLYSSGTTGRPKGVKQPLPEGPVEQPSGLALLLQARYGIGPDTVYLCPAPLYHAAPVRWCMTFQSVGGTVVIMEKFDAAKALALIERYRVTHAQWVPTHFARLLKLPDADRDRDVSSLRQVFHAAAPCPPAVKEAMIAWWGPIVSEYYGATENNGMTLIDAEDWLAHRGSVGRAVDGVAHICDETGRELAVGETGMIYFSGGKLFEYHNDPGKTAKTRNALGWTTTGDMGWLDPEGYLFLADRKDFMIISGGVNVYPREVEDLLVAHPEVTDAAVIGLPDEDLGQKVVAVIQPTDPDGDTDALTARLTAYLIGQISGVKRPRVFFYRRELPRLPTGKLMKRVLVAELTDASAVA